MNSADARFARLEQLKHDAELKVRLVAASGCPQSLYPAFLRQSTHRRNQPRLPEPTRAFEEQRSARAGTREADDLRGELPCLVPLNQREASCVSSELDSGGRVRANDGRLALHALRLGAVRFWRNYRKKSLYSWFSRASSSNAATRPLSMSAR